eukprot:TRINITY_DN19141_c0_g1_i1.p1 TRINITY_DN19141_c0_g1~~TRINITY_DN19141_c0_g1_i1.p1  ORF type:complete len:348 (-),score=79.26 TRINITY_DN19141_c0_g1_i1:116-1159(-)
MATAAMATASCGATCVARTAVAAARLGSTSLPAASSRAPPLLTRQRPQLIEERSLSRRCFCTPSAASSASKAAPAEDAKLPIVLAHGFFGGRCIPGSPIEYFRGIGADLSAAGHEVLLTEVPPTAHVSVRAEALLEQIQGWEARRGRRVAVLAHSMGGLDARFAASRLGGSSLLRTLLSISTPHRGSPVADALLRSGDALGLTSLLRTLPVSLLADLPTGGGCLCTEAAAEFNAQVPDAEGVRYLSVGGDRGSALRTSPELIPTHAYVSAQEGPNDGLVSVRSARWGIYLGTLDMDHLHQMNFPLPHRWLSGAPSYAEVLRTYRRLAARAAFEDCDGDGLNFTCSEA